MGTDLQSAISSRLTRGLHKRRLTMSPSPWGRVPRYLQPWKQLHWQTIERSGATSKEWPAKPPARGTVRTPWQATEGRYRCGEPGHIPFYWRALAWRRLASRPPLDRDGMAQREDCHSRQPLPPPPSNIYDSQTMTSVAAIAEPGSTPGPSSPSSEWNEGWTGPNHRFGGLLSAVSPQSLVNVPGWGEKKIPQRDQLHC